MSRVYEALKKAERQRVANDLRTEKTSVLNGSIQHSVVNGAETHWDHSPDERPPAKPELIRVDRLSTNKLKPFQANSKGPLLVVGQANRAAETEPFHLLALNLQTWVIENRKRCLTVTSALSGEGKSFISLNLAASLAMLGNRVLLIDADLRRPTLHYSFNIAPGRGLMQYLNGECEFDACLHSTPISGLTLIAAGGTSQRPTELFARPLADTFIKKAHALSPEHYILIDSPAASVVPEPQIINRLAEAALFVVAANRTPREIVKRSLESLADTSLYGLVLNRFEPQLSMSLRYPNAYQVRYPMRSK
jgi:capsular exopolysaccharide synthesis family protein